MFDGRFNAEEKAGRAGCEIDSMYQAKFEERKQESIFQGLQDNKDLTDRYSTSKLLQIIITKQLAKALSAKDPGDAVTVACLNPGLCDTSLFRNATWPISVFISLLVLLFARTAEAGSRTLMAAAEAGPEFHGKYMSDCKPCQFPEIMRRGEESEALERRVWGELVLILEAIRPEVTEVVGGYCGLSMDERLKSRLSPWALEFQLLLPSVQWVA